MLIATLETAQPGDKFLLAVYGDGADTLILEVTDEIKKLKDKKTFQSALA